MDFQHVNAIIGENFALRTELNQQHKEIQELQYQKRQLEKYNAKLKHTLNQEAPGL